MNGRTRESDDAEAVNAAHRAGFEAGMTHAIAHARENPEFATIACVIVEDWVRKLAGKGGLDISIRNTGRRVVGLWNEEGEVAKSSSLFDTLSAYQRELDAESPKVFPDEEPG